MNMIDRIKAVLAGCGVENWRITASTAETAELYFIKKALDIPRIKQLTKYTVDVFRDFEEDGSKFRGRSNALLCPGMSDEEIKKRVESAYFAASFVKNPWFELPAAVTEEHRACSSDLAAMRPEEAAVRLATAVDDVDTAEDAFINSLEIFVTKESKHIIASNGLDVCFDTCTAEGELVAQCVTPKDVEQFREFKYDCLAIDSLKARVLDAINDVRARASGEKPPKAGAYDIILRGEDIGEVLSYYAARSSAGIIYPGYSKWTKGTNVQGDSIEKEKLDITLKATEPYSDEGVPMIDRPLVKDGVLETIHGGSRHCFYLGVPPTGNYSKIVCGNGTVPLAEMQSEGVLELFSFSDFQMDFFDGHFKGEIRLALLHKADGTTEPLTGGSINGCLPDVQGNLVFSKERYADSEYEGPLAVLIPGVSVAGAEE